MDGGAPRDRRGQARRFTVDDIRRARARACSTRPCAPAPPPCAATSEIDPIVGLKGLEALTELKREYAPAIDLQLCAFAQEGILQLARDRGAARAGPRETAPI